MSIGSRFLSIILLVFFSNYAFCDEEITDLYTRFKHYEVGFKGQKDGSWVDIRRWAMHVFN